MCVGVGGEPGKTAPTHPPSAGVSFGRAAVRDASVIPCRGALGVRAECGVGTLRRYQPGRYLAGTKASTACQFNFFRSSLVFFYHSFSGDGCGSDPGGTASYLAYIKNVGRHPGRSPQTSHSAHNNKECAFSSETNSFFVGTGCPVRNDKKVRFSQNFLHQTALP